MAVPTRNHTQRILVVDDHAENRMLMRDLLTRQGYEVLVAGDADVAADIMRQSQPDLVLLDVIMPGKSGYELCREWKDAPETRLIPVVMITGLSDLEDKIRGIEAGADDFLNKPIFPVELFARVASLLRVKDYTDELENADTVLCTLGRSVESRDPYTEGHCERLAAYASELGRFLGLGDEDQLALTRGGFLHDLGKIAIADEILQQAGIAYARRVAHHAHASGHRRKHLQAAALAAPGAAHHSPPSRALERHRLSGPLGRGGDSPAGARSAGGGCLRRLAYRAPLQAGALLPERARNHARRSPARACGTATSSASSFP